MSSKDSSQSTITYLYSEIQHLNNDMKSHAFIISIALLIITASCGSKPKVIEEETPSAPAHTHEQGASSEISNTPHTVVCQDFLHTEKYTYMDVTEDGQRFWIAVPRQEVEKGATYHYTGGLMKKNFKSTEYDRVFETIYLVSAVTRHELFSGGSAVDRALAQQQQQPATTPVNIAPSSGDIVKISDVLANRTQYDGKVISVRGRCVKINKMIMGRNWVHIDDGSVSGTDLTVTTTADVAVGTTVTMTGTIALNKDFGAGYRYEVIMEGAKAE
jgi:hypothetical protein